MWSPFYSNTRIQQTGSVFSYCIYNSCGLRHGTCLQVLSVDFEKNVFVVLIILEIGPIS